MKNAFLDLNSNELDVVNGGGVGGAMAGWIFGGCAGLFGYAISTCISGKATANGIWKAYTAGALGGAGIGLYIPV